MSTLKEVTHSLYYKAQLDKLEHDFKYAMSMVIVDANGNKTKSLALNTESIPVIIAFLKKEEEHAKLMEETNQAG